MIVMLTNQVELWETMLAGIKLGAVLIPCTVQLTPADLADRVERGDARWVVTNQDQVEKFASVPGDFTLIQVGGSPTPGVLDYGDSLNAAVEFSLDEPRGPMKRCCCTSPRAPRPGRSWWSTPTPPTPWGI